MQRIEFRVLGPFEVSVEGRAIELKRRKQRALMALLLLHAGEVVSTDRLIEELWAGKPPKAAVGSLQNLISDLRKALGRDVVRTRQPGYVLDVDREHVDVHRFERLTAEASERGDAEQRSELLREGLRLWRGPPLADLAFEPFAQVEIARLEELRSVAREDLVDAGLELGRHAQLVGELEALVAEHPLRERLRGQLMLALYRSGRQAEALEAYREGRQTLVEELGIEPSSDLQQLEQAILRHDPHLNLPARVIAPRQEPEPDRRRTVTVLFTDVVDSTALSAALDPEVMRAVMSRYFDAVRLIIERHGGTVEKFIGDAAMAAFGIPQQHEDDALRAVRAAAEMREAITGLNADLEREHGVVIQIRTAINTGQVVAGDPASGQPFATGSAINVAMKLHEAALPAEILLGPTTNSLVRESVATERVEPVELAALEHTAVYRLVSISDTARLRPPAHAAFVGRGDELARLRSAFEQARTKSLSGALTVLGEAGIGKSRLIRELATSLAHEARFVVGRCVSYGEGATYLPLAEIVQQIAPKRPHSTIASLLAGNEDAELVATRLNELTGEGAGGGSSGEVFWAVRLLLEALAREQPLVVVLEDVHWAEPTLLDLVEYLAAWTVPAPLLIVCLARPELREERPGLGAGVDVLTLEPLEETAVGALVGELGGPDVDAAARDRIVAVAEGNPLFVEQLLAFLEEAGPGALESVPPTVDALLASRIDRLDAEERAVLERAAVVGREFKRAAVIHLTPPEELPAVDARLRTLARRGLIFALRDTEDGFRFHHVLIRDVTYTGITKEARGSLHERLAAWLEIREEHADEIIGYHLEQAHRYRAELHARDPELPSLAERAGERLATAGIRAWKRADAPAAINLIGRAAAHLPPGASRSESLCELAGALRTSGQIGDAEAVLRQAIDDSMGRDRRLELRARVELARIGSLVDPHGQSAVLLELAEDAIPLFEELGDDRSLGRTWLGVAYVRGGVFGDNKAREEAAERALLHYRKSGWSPAMCFGVLGAAFYHGPRPVPEATRRCEELLEDAASDLASQANIVVFLAGLEAMRGRFDLARELLTRARTTFEEIGLTTAVANFCGTVGGMIETTSGDYARAEAILRESCLQLEEMRERALLSTRAAELGEALVALGRLEEAAQWLSVSGRHAASDDADAHSARLAAEAELKTANGDLAEAEKLSREAVRLAGTTDMLNRQGRTLLVLAEVLRLQGRFSDAVAPTERAARVFARKGSVALERKARAFLEELVVS